MYNIKTFVGAYDKNEFYMIMGKYFAERVYRKKLPYLINDKDKIWHLFYCEDELAGFVGLKVTKLYTNISDIYYLDNMIENNILESIIDFIIKNYKPESIKILTNNKYEINFFKSYGFIEKGNKGSYINLELGGNNERKNNISSIRC